MANSCHPRQFPKSQIKRLRTGIEVTFNIKTETEEQQVRNIYRKKGKRWVKLGQVINGRVKLTKFHSKEKTSQLYRDILNDPTHYSGFTYQHEMIINLCNRRLSNSTSASCGTRMRKKNKSIMLIELVKSHDQPTRILLYRPPR